MPSFSDQFENWSDPSLFALPNVAEDSSESFDFSIFFGNDSAGQDNTQYQPRLQQADPYYTSSTAPPSHDTAINPQALSQDFVEFPSQGFTPQNNGDASFHSHYPPSPEPWQGQNPFNFNDPMNAELIFGPGEHRFSRAFNDPTYPAPFSDDFNYRASHPSGRPTSFNSDNAAESHGNRAPSRDQPALRRSGRNAGQHKSYRELDNGDYDDSTFGADGTATPSESPSEPKGKRNMNHNWVPEKPKKDNDKPWVRTNGITQGLSSRTGKINNYGDGPYDAETKHPVGDWVSASGTKFKYNRFGELEGTSLSTEKLAQFIYQHPLHTTHKDKGRLTMWVQKVPGDSGRRYPSRFGAHCRFENCPTRAFKNRTIAQGHFRVAFDEQWKTHKGKRNPFHNAGYVHLYCLERFLDFKDICSRFKVKADHRDFPSEPRGEWKGSLGRITPECTDVKSFIDWCKEGKHSQEYSWSETYPSHRTGVRKPHEHTLTRAMYRSKETTIGDSKMKMMKNRGQNGTMFFVNKGDLEVMVKAHQKRTKARAKARTNASGKNVASDSDSDEDDAPTAGAGNAVYTNSSNAAPTALMTGTGASKRKADEVEDTDESDRYKYARNDFGPNQMFTNPFPPTLSDHQMPATQYSAQPHEAISPKSSSYQPTGEYNEPSLDQVSYWNQYGGPEGAQGGEVDNTRFPSIVGFDGEQMEENF